MIPRRLYREFHGTLIADHLKRLQGEDRRLRFGAMMSDSAIDSYVDGAWDINHLWYGIVEGDRVIAAVHAARDADKAELGLSVDPDWRGNKLGQALFDRAVIALKARDVQFVYMHCLSENTIVKHIARKNHMVMVTEYGETDADMRLADSTPMDVGINLFVEQLALYDSAARNTTKALVDYYHGDDTSSP